jgi:hypothetical protein
MIGRGSRILKHKTTFTVIDLGNNLHRFGPWGSDLDWQRIFRSPNYYLDGILSDEDIETNFKYEMPEDLRQEFAKSEEVYFDINKTYISSVRNGESSKVVLERSIAQHGKICIENSEDLWDALGLAKLLTEDINYRIGRYTKCISKSTYNFVDWLKDDYKKKLNAYLRTNFDRVFEEINGYPPED